MALFNLKDCLSYLLWKIPYYRNKKRKEKEDLEKRFKRYDRYKQMKDSQVSFKALWALKQFSRRGSSFSFLVLNEKGEKEYYQYVVDHAIPQSPIGFYQPYLYTEYDQPNTVRFMKLLKLIEQCRGKEFIIKGVETLHDLIEDNEGVLKPTLTIRIKEGIVIKEIEL